MGITRADSLCHSLDALTEFIDMVEERMFQLPLVGPRFEEDNRVVSVS